MNHQRNWRHQLAPTWMIVSLLAICISHLNFARAELVIKTSEPKTYGQKTIIKMDLHNTFTNKIESARAVVFLSDEKGKVVGQETRWIIGGTKDRPPLASDAKATFNFVVQHEKPFTKSKITVTRLILEGGQIVNARKEVRIE